MCPLAIHWKGGAYFRGGLTFGRGLTFQIIQYLLTPPFSKRCILIYGHLWLRFWWVNQSYIPFSYIMLAYWRTFQPTRYPHSGSGGLLWVFFFSILFPNVINPWGLSSTLLKVFYILWRSCKKVRSWTTPWILTPQFLMKHLWHSVTMETCLVYKWLYH